MTVLEAAHDDHGATWTEYGGRRVVASYGRPERTHRAVRNAVGVIELGYGIVELTGEDRVEFVNNTVTNDVPEADGEGCYALLLDAQGGIEADMYIYNAAERLLLFVPPDRAEPLVEDWSSKVFIQDVTVTDRTEDLAVFGVYGKTATEKVASVLNHAGSPEPALSFVRGSMADVGVSVIASDGITGEEGYEVVCPTADAEEVFDTLVNRGMNAAPFGYQTWRTLTLEAGTPLFASELEGRLPNVAGVRSALDFEKGCFVGQEVVSKVENRGQPSKRLVGLRFAKRGGTVIPTAGDELTVGDRTVGEMTRAGYGPSAETVLGFAYVDYGLETDGVTVHLSDGEVVSADLPALPFVEGTARSARIPTYVD